MYPYGNSGVVKGYKIYILTPDEYCLVRTARVGEDNREVVPVKQSDEVDIEAPELSS